MPLQQLLAVAAADELEAQRHLVGGRVVRVQGSGFRVQGSGFRVQGLGVRVRVRLAPRLAIRLGFWFRFGLGVASLTWLLPT